MSSLLELTKEEEEALLAERTRAIARTDAPPMRSGSFRDAVDTTFPPFYLLTRYIFFQHLQTTYHVMAAPRFDAFQIHDESESSARHPGMRESRTKMLARVAQVSNRCLAAEIRDRAGVVVSLLLGLENRALEIGILNKMNDILQHDCKLLLSQYFQLLRSFRAELFGRDVISPPERALYARRFVGATKDTAEAMSRRVQRWKNEEMPTPYDHSLIRSLRFAHHDVMQHINAKLDEESSAFCLF